MKTILMLALILPMASAVCVCAGADRVSTAVGLPAERVRPPQEFQLAKKYDVPLRVVRSVRGRGLQWEEVDQALRISRQSGKSAGQIADMRKKGLSWEAIEKKTSFKPEGLRDAVGGTRRGSPKRKEK